MQNFYDAADKLVYELKGNLKKRWQERLCPAMFREVDGGRVQNWNSGLITLGDYLLTGWLLPGGFFLSIGLRWILGKIPVVKNLMPANLLKDHMIKAAEESLGGQLPLLVEEFRTHLANEQVKIADFISDANQKEIDHQQGLLDAIAERACNADIEFDAAAVHKKMNELGDFLKQLA